MIHCRCGALVPTFVRMTTTLPSPFFFGLSASTSQLLQALTMQTFVSSGNSVAGGGAFVSVGGGAFFSRGCGSAGRGTFVSTGGATFGSGLTSGELTATGWDFFSCAGGLLAAAVRGLGRSSDVRM